MDHPKLIKKNIYTRKNKKKMLRKNSKSRKNNKCNVCGKRIKHGG